MKSSACFLILVLSSQILFSQTNLIPNPSFENWLDGEPLNWQTNNDTLRNRIPVTQSSVAYHGSSAIQLETIDYNGLAGGAFVHSDTFSVGVLEERPIELSGYYRFAPVGDAICVANVIVFNYFGSFLVTCGFGIDTLAATDEYTRFTIPIFYGSPFDTAVSVSINLKVHSQVAHEQSIGALSLFDSLTLSTSITDIEGHRAIRAEDFKLLQNYPNPFNPSTTIEFEISKTMDVRIEVFTIKGQIIETPLNRKMPAGKHRIMFNAPNLSSGVYFYKIAVGEFHEVKKMILLR
jgi:hypothetical protein